MYTSLLKCFFEPNAILMIVYGGAFFMRFHCTHPIFEAFINSLNFIQIFTTKSPFYSSKAQPIFFSSKKTSFLFLDFVGLFL